MRITEFVNKPYVFTKEEENTPNWYIQLKGKNLGEPYPNKKTANSKALELSYKKRIPLSDLHLTKSWGNAPVKESLDDTDAEGYRIPRAKRDTNGVCWECGGIKDLQPCGTKIHNDPICVTCRKKFGYKPCSGSYPGTVPREKCPLFHIKGICPESAYTEK